MRLLSLVIVGLSLTTLADVVNADDRFNSELRWVDVISPIHRQTAQMDCSRERGP